MDTPDSGGGQHRRIDSSGPAASEPVMVAHAVHVLLAAIVATGWVMIPDRTIDIVTSAVAVVLSTLAAVAARSRVTPADPITWPGVQAAIRDLVSQELAKLLGSAAVLNTPPVAPGVVEDAPRAVVDPVEATAAFPAVTAPAPSPTARIRGWQ